MTVAKRHLRWSAFTRGWVGGYQRRLGLRWRAQPAMGWVGWEVRAASSKARLQEMVTRNECSDDLHTQTTGPHLFSFWGTNRLPAV